MDEGKDERIDEAGNVGATIEVVVPNWQTVSAVTRIEPPQLRADIEVQVKSGRFKFRPTRDITAYQLALVMRLLFSCVNMRCCWAIDDAFAEVYAETAEQWGKVE